MDSTGSSVSYQCPNESQPPLDYKNKPRNKCEKYDFDKPRNKEYMCEGDDISNDKAWYNINEGDFSTLTAFSTLTKNTTLVAAALIALILIVISVILIISG